MAEIDRLSSPHLVLTDIGCNGSVFTDMLVESQQSVSRSHAAAVVKRLLFVDAKLSDFLLPFGALGLFKHRNKLLKRELDITAQTVGIIGRF